MFDHSWGGESVEMKDQGGDSPLHQRYNPNIDKSNVASLKKGGKISQDFVIPPSEDTAGSVKDKNFA